MYFVQTEGYRGHFTLLQQNSIERVTRIEFTCIFNIVP